MKYLIHIRPPPEMVEKMHDLLDKTPTVERYLKLPHCTVMRVITQSANEHVLIDEIKGITAGMKPFKLSGDVLDLYSESDGISRDILVLKLLRSEPLYDFHQECLSAFVKIIDWESARSSLRVVPDNERWRKYGDSHYGDVYSPHISLAKMAPDIFSSVDTRQFSGSAWIVKSIYLCRRDPTGWTTIGEFPLR